MSDPDRAPRARMTPERWAQLQPLIDAALDLAPDRRGAFYESVASSHPDLRADLERLVNRIEDDCELFASAAAERFALLLDETTREPPPDILPQLQASLGTAYSLERELGGGGMSRVFLARELGLGRRVVIKVLPPELAAGINAERFDREIKLAASLQQANVVPLLATGRAAGYAYYTMPFVEGRSLRERLTREGVLPIGEAVNLLRDVARALAYAHSQGVVHRDIKPGNVLLSGGTAVVTDFGIAKALTAARGDAAFGPITNPGPGIGTPPYMAPEQAAGDPAVDHRADIYAFGCLAYEMFTGKPPFQGHAPHVIIAAHFQDAPRPVTEGRSDVPPAIASLIAQCLEKNPARRPQSASDLLDALDVVTSQPTQPVRRRLNAMVLRSVVVLVAAVGIAAGYLAYRAGRETPAAADTPPDFAAAAATMKQDTQPSFASAADIRTGATDKTAAPPPLTLAAIPFTNLTHDSTLEYRAEGISDEILTVLGKVPGVRIVGRNGGRQYKDSAIAELVVQRALHAVFLITGSYQERDGQITVSVQLNDSIARGEVWSETFEALTDWRSLPDTIARAVAAQLHERYDDRVREPKWGAIRLAKVSLEAWEDYQGGQFFFRRRKLKESVERFEAALRLEPSYARAHGALALAFTLSGVFLDAPPRDVTDTVLKTAQRALGLDSTAADAHAAIAMVSPWDSAKTHFRRALELDPDNFEIHLTFGRVSTLRGDLREARRQLELAKTLEPTSALVFAWSSYEHFLNGEKDLALKESDRAILLDSTAVAVTNLGALMYVELGDSDQARRLTRLQKPGNPMTTAPYVYAKLHDTATALRLVTRLESTHPPVADVQRASVMLAMNDTVRTLDALEKSGRSRANPFRGVIPPCDPAWDPVRKTPRFKALVRQAGLDTLRLTEPGGCRR